MASEIKQGNSVFFVFKDGKSMLDSQRHPRMYNSMRQLQSKCPDLKYGAVPVEYVPKAKIASPELYVEALNNLIRIAIFHGGDVGGAYFSEPCKMAAAVDCFMSLTGLDYDIEWENCEGNVTGFGYIPKVVLK